jgi:hypothetical protein
MVKGVGERAERAAALPMVAVKARDDNVLDPNELPATTARDALESSNLN